MTTDPKPANIDLHRAPDPEAECTDKALETAPGLVLRTRIGVAQPPVFLPAVGPAPDEPAQA